MEPTERFTSRVSDYARYRPSYPQAVVELLRQNCGLRAGSRVADVGGGTGIFSRLLLEAEAEVVLVEPNGAMREAADLRLGSHPRYRSVAGTAEATTLAEHSVDLVTCAQAWHWFEAERARQEFARILVPDGWLLLVWNERLTDATPFLREYEFLLSTLAAEYLDVRHREFDSKRLASVFSPRPMVTASYPNAQTLDREAFFGRVLSSSYIPQVGHPGHEPLMTALSELFHRHQEEGRVEVRYTTECYYGQL